MKITILVDKPRSAIDRLCQAIKRHNPHLDIDICSLHPKRPDLDQIERATKSVQACDILFVGYWRSAEKIKEYIDISQKKKMCWLNNPYDL